MKIIHVIESGGGTTVFVLYLVKYLKEHHHHLICSDRTFENKPFTGYPNLSIHPWRHVKREISPVNDFRAVVSLYRLLKEIDADVIHLHSSKAGFLGRVVTFLLRKKNVIYTPNGAAFLRTDVSPVKRKLYVLFEKLADKLSGRVVGCSKSEADAYINEGIPATYVNNGTEVVTVAETFSRNDDTFVIATVGRTTAQKGPEIFNRIAKHFEGDDRIKFLWIGTGELDHILTAKNITITGWLGKQDVLKTVARSDLYLSTALWEGLPFAVLEAMQLGRALLLTRCVGNVDLVKEELNGFVFSRPEEAVSKIEWFLQNPVDCKKMGMKSYDLALKEFSVDGMAAKYDLEYKTPAKS